MSRITSAVVVSDLHLGRDSSYLHTRNVWYDRNREAVAALLAAAGPRDECIINGDLLELSVAGLDSVWRDLRAFVELLAGSGPYRRIVYLPGNHDHHVWRWVVERVEIEGRIRRDLAPPGPDEYPHLFVDRRHTIEGLAGLWPAGVSRPEIAIKYPHHLVTIGSPGSAERHYFITHGHFLEALYKPVNLLIEPAHLEELEAFNNLWLEAFNYHLGQAGRLSQRVTEVVRSYERGGRDARRKVREICDAAFANVRRKVPPRLTVRAVLYVFRRFIYRWIARLLPPGPEGALRGVGLGAELTDEIARYVDRYVLKRYRRDRAREYRLPAGSDIPAPFTFVYGHTHRLIASANGTSPCVTIGGMSFPLENTGGWLRTDGAPGAMAGALVIGSDGARWESLAGQLE